MDSTTHPPVRILLVEDEELLREFAAESLREEGFDVQAVGDGDAGLEVLQSNAPLDLLLSDIRLPGASGYELAEAGRTLRPGLKMILMTGYAPRLPTTLELAVHCVLQKPFGIAALTGVISAALASDSGAVPG
ncbi:MAG TPA: response regulator [Rhodanobacteraceae bacterium]|nr:response regulator [Rhodanobacteraceae bacterium]